MRIPRHSAALFAALTLAGSVGAAPRSKRAPAAPPGASQEWLDRLARAELLAGITEVTGPGLIVTLRHSPRTIKGVDPDALLIHDQDLNGVLNALRAAGAEALAVSGAQTATPERILVTSAAAATADGILINGTRLTPPYRILALGGGDAMRTELFRPGGVVKKAGLDTLQMIELESVSELVIPACRKSVAPRFARATAPVAPVSNPIIPAPGVSTVPPEKPLTVPAASAPPAVQEEPRAPNPLPGSPAPAPNRVVGILPRTRPAVSPEPVKPFVKPAPAKPETVPVKPEAIVQKPVEKEPAKERPHRVASKNPPAVPAAPMPAADLGLFGGKGLAKYHAAGCRFGERIEKGERVLFTSAEAARQAGRVPCSICLHGAAERSAAH